MISSGGRRFVAAFGAAALLAAACGSGTDPRDRSGDGGDGFASTAEAGDDVTPPDQQASAGESTYRQPGGSAAPEPPPGSGPVRFGDLEVPCGPGTATGATDQGVTDTEIRIASGDDRGATASPGLNHEQGDAIEALVAYCNALGGIEGRQIVLDLKDAALVDVGLVMSEACEDDFMLVGVGFVLEDQGEAIRVACGLPVVSAWAESAAVAHGPLAYQPVPDPADRMSLGPAMWLAETYPEAIGSSAIVNSIDAPGIDARNKVIAAYTDLDYEFDLVIGYRPAEPVDWDAIVDELAAAEVELVHFAGACVPDFRDFRQAADDAGFAPVHAAGPAFYARACAEANDDGAMDATFVPTMFIPFEEADSSPATAEYLRLVTDHGGDVALPGAQATSAFWLWATAARACGSQLTRACVVDQIAQTVDWTSGGLHAPSSPGSNEPPACGIVLELVGTDFVRRDPPTPGTFACDAAYLAEIVTPASARARLNADRISTVHLDD